MSLQTFQGVRNYFTAPRTYYNHFTVQINNFTAEITAFIEAAPSGKYAWMIGFLYEFLTQQKLVLNKPISGNYVDLLDTDKYITGKIVKDARWVKSKYSSVPAGNK